MAEFKGDKILAIIEQISKATLPEKELKYCKIMMKHKGLHKNTYIITIIPKASVALCWLPLLILRK